MAVEPVDLPLESTAGNLGGVQPIPLVRCTITGFIGRSERGPLDEPVELANFDEFRRTFGGHCGLSFLSHAVQHYFLQGGEAAVVVRAANRATRARIDVPAQGQFLHLQARHPGAHECLRVSVDYDRIGPDAQRFNLVIQRLRGPGSPLIVDQEIFADLSMRHSDDRFVVDALQESKLVRLSGPLPGNRPDATLAAFSGQPIPYIAMTQAGTDGEELTDYDVIGSNLERTGLFALERVRGGIDFLCVPSAPGADLGTTAFLAAERFCARQRALLIYDPPSAWTSVHAAVIGMRAMGHSSRNAMTYFPRIRPRSEAGRFAGGMPACGAVAGLLARQDRSGIWAPEPVGALRSSLAPAVPVHGREAALLKRFGINALASTNGETAQLTGNVTFGGANAISTFWERLDRRRLFLFVVKSIEEATRWAAAALEAPGSAEQLERQLATFLARLFEQGALAGASAAQAFFVRVVAQPRGLTARVGVALQRPAEFVSNDFVYTADGIRVRAVPSLEAAQALS